MHLRTQGLVLQRGWNALANICNARRRGAARLLYESRGGDASHGNHVARRGLRGALREDAAAYAKDTGNLAWYYRLGPAGEVGSVASIKDQLRMTESCGSVHNGASGDGWSHNGTPTTDRSIYTVVVNQHGSEVFTRDYGCGGNTYNHFVDLDGSGVKKVLTFESHDATYYHGWCKIHLLDGGTGSRPEEL